MSPTGPGRWRSIHVYHSTSCGNFTVSFAKSVPVTPLSLCLTALWLTSVLLLAVFTCDKPTVTNFHPSILNCKLRNSRNYCIFIAVWLNEFYIDVNETKIHHWIACKSCVLEGRFISFLHVHTWNISFITEEEITELKPFQQLVGYASRFLYRQNNPVRHFSYSVTGYNSWKCWFLFRAHPCLT